MFDFVNFPLSFSHDITNALSSASPVGTLDRYLRIKKQNYIHRIIVFYRQQNVYSANDPCKTNPLGPSYALCYLRRKFKFQSIRSHTSHYTTCRQSYSLENICLHLQTELM
ncbi:Uncharacterised protein at_DN0809 [Pycnogonum litorale]